jgi:CheY-like chemotaxis protein
LREKGVERPLEEEFQFLMKDSTKRYYKILELEADASPQEVKQAYHDLVQIWHPDRFTHYPRLKQIANEKLKLINEAYAKLQSSKLGGGTRASSKSEAAYVAQKSVKHGKRRVFKTLVVDDEPAFCELLREFLVDKGYHVAVANDGDEALTVYRHERPDIVFLDQRMPGKDGLETLLELKAFDPNVAVIMISAFGNDEIVERSKGEGAFFIHKPINFKYLELAIETKLGLRERIINRAS